MEYYGVQSIDILLGKKLHVHRKLLILLKTSTNKSVLSSSEAFKYYRIRKNL